LRGRSFRLFGQPMNFRRETSNDGQSVHANTPQIKIPDSSPTWKGLGRDNPISIRKYDMRQAPLLDHWSRVQGALRREIIAVGRRTVG
jgi:hypothetical protein